jgi:adenylate kinase
MKLILLGAPGAGKGTVAKLLTKIDGSASCNSGLKGSPSGWIASTPNFTMVERKTLSVKLDAAVEIDVPRDIILDRLTTRRTCAGCGAIYNIKVFWLKSLYQLGFVCFFDFYFWIRVND